MSQGGYLRLVALCAAAGGLLALSWLYSRKLEQLLLIAELERIPTLAETG